MIILLQNISADTVGEALSGDGKSKQLLVSATDFGGGSVTLEVSLDKTNWAPLTKGGVPAVYTANATDYARVVGMATYIRATLSGSTNPSNLNVFLF